MSVIQQLQHNCKLGRHSSFPGCNNVPPLSPHVLIVQRQKICHGQLAACARQGRRVYLSLDERLLLHADEQVSVMEDGLNY